MNRGLLRGLPGYEQAAAAVPLIPSTGIDLAYREFTAQVALTATTEATANTIVTAPAVTFDGLTAVIIEFFAMGLQDAVSGEIALLWLYMDGASIGRLGDAVGAATVSLDHRQVCFARRRLTPPTGSRTFSIRGSSGGNGNVEAGVGGAGNVVPGYIMISRVV